ncbi:hypothetical protein C8Q77DRAFT_669838 [Trametes polyzona]|nr:hypothetical protein C8Q77DRAFT_669838 [Trametes polyzona]
MDSGLEELLEDAAYNLTMLTMVKYAGVLSITLLLLEVLSTLDDEITFIWPSRWSIMKIIFMFNRYSPFVDATANIIMMLATKTSKTCQILYDLMACAYVAGSLSSEFILMARTLALYDFARFVVALMCLLSLGLLAYSIVVVRSFLSTVKYPDDAVLHITGCVVSVEARSTWALFMCVLISETVMVLLTGYKMWLTYDERSHRSLLVRTMYRDGSLDYFVLFAFSTTNLCFMLLAPKAASPVVQMPLRVVHSALCTRVLLNLRKVAAKLTEMTFDELRQTQLAFGPSPLDTPVHQRSSYIDLEMDTLESENPCR